MRGIELRSLTENIDTATASGRLVFDIFGALAESERAVIRERTRVATGVRECLCSDVAAAGTAARITPTTQCIPPQR